MLTRNNSKNLCAIGWIYRKDIIGGQMSSWRKAQRLSAVKGILRLNVLIEE